MCSVCEKVFKATPDFDNLDEDTLCSRLQIEKEHLRKKIEKALTHDNPVMEIFVLGLSCGAIFERNKKVN